MVPELPPPITNVVVPGAFAPSTWLRMEACPLSVWADEHATLAPAVKAVVGRVLHSAREEVLNRNLVGPQNTAAVREVVESARIAEENRIAASPDPLGVSLDQAYGSRRWLQRVLWLEAWARGISERRAGRRSSPASHSKALTTDCFALGTEPTWRATSLRLVGRPDEAWLSDRGDVVVSDYKTGFVVGRDGQIAPHVEVQIRLYLLMAEELTGGRVVGLVEGAGSTPVRWNSDVREMMRRRVAEFGERFPAGATVAATDVATPGAQCQRCRLRPRCATYLRAATAWWPNTGGHPRPLPADAWGRVSLINVDPLGVGARLVDDAGHTILVRGLDPGRRVADLPIGSRLLLFDLEATEDAVVHGRRIHPRTFHERAPGPRWRQALRTRAFVGGTR